jgi:integrase
VLTAAEIKAVWDATPRDDGSWHSDHDVIVRLLLLTGCRANEIAALRWDEVKEDRIVLPKERTKNKRQHAIPLTATMRALLAARVRRSGPYVFGRFDGVPFDTPSGRNVDLWRLTSRLHRG